MLSIKVCKSFEKQQMINTWTFPQIIKLAGREIFVLKSRICSGKRGRMVTQDFPV